jgi:hypothetical protein
VTLAAGVSGFRGNGINPQSGDALLGLMRFLDANR